MTETNGTAPTNGSPVAPTEPTDRLQPWQVLGLNAAQEEFARLRVAHPHDNATALIRMMDVFKGKSKSMQTNLGHRFAKNPAIAKRTRQLEREAVRAVEKRKRHKLSGKRVLRELTDVALSDLRDLVEIGDDGVVRVKPTCDWPDRAAKAVASIANSPDGIKLSLHAKLDALGKLARITKLLGDDAPGVTPLQIGKVLVLLPDNGRGVTDPAVPQLETVTESELPPGVDIDVTQSKEAQQ